ncbi:MAG: VWA domain-containing protein [Fimbriimonadaceae bacterium]|nr:MAG: VWA domain-containing protein [Fimbriimonadaceae bacterium]
MRRSKGRSIRATRNVGGLALAAVLGLALPARIDSWGTLTGRIPLSDEQRTKINLLITNFAVDPTTMAAELQPRSGPHPIHQFIVSQAYRMLQADPAFGEEGESGFPALHSINAWDGVEHTDKGMMARIGVGIVDADAPDLAPTFRGAGGPSADAELTLGNAWNPEYSGRAHYWNPWLGAGGRSAEEGSGDAPWAAGEYYARLVQAIETGGSEQDKAHFAAYMAHYVSDVASAKHADAFEVSGGTLKRLRELADTWYAGLGEDPDTYINSTPVIQAETLLRDEVLRINPSVANAYWRRVEDNIRANAYLRPGSIMKVDIMPQSIRSSVAAYLDYLYKGKKENKSYAQFYSYFDPFYFNGPLYDPLNGYPDYEAATPMSEHLHYETNPDHYATARAATRENRTLLPTDNLRRHYYGLRAPEAFYGFKEKERREARIDVMANLVKACSLEAHGTNIADYKAFNHAGYREYMDTAIKYTFNAFRASISALRIEPYYTLEKDNDFRMRIVVKNLADEAASLSGLRLYRLESSAEGARIVRQWDLKLSGTVPAKGEHVVKGTIRKVELPEGTDPVFDVEVRASYRETPDSGVQRRRAQKRAQSIIHNPTSVGDVGYEAGPLDIAIVLDTTSSMGRMLASMRENAIRIVEDLRLKTKDIRLCVVSFRDAKADKNNAFEAHNFTTELGKQFERMRVWEPIGGGDWPEDQLRGIELALNFWKNEKPSSRIPTKIVIVISDAPAHAPDSGGRTITKIADLAERVDPAHIYPIVVGSDTNAKAHAEKLASLTGGKVLSSTSGADVADLLLEAVETGIREHGAPPEAAASVPWSSVAFYGGLGLLLAGGAVLLAGRRGA